MLFALTLSLNLATLVVYACEAADPPDDIGIRQPLDAGRDGCTSMRICSETNCRRCEEQALGCPCHCFTVCR